MENQPKTNEEYNQAASGQTQPEAVKRTAGEWTALEKYEIERDARRNASGRYLNSIMNPFGPR